MDLTPSVIMGIAGQAATAVAAGWVIWLRIRKKLMSWQDSLTTSEKLIATFGAEPAAEIRKLIKVLEDTSDSNEVRQNIICAHLKIGLYMCDLNAHCTYANPMLGDILGIDRENCLGWGWLQAIKKEEQARVRINWAMSVKEKLPYQETYTLKDGTVVTTEAFLSHGKSMYVGYVAIVTYPGKQIAKEN